MGFRRGRRRGLVAGAVIGSAVANSKKNNSEATESAAVAPDAAAGQSDMATQLQELKGLLDQGILTQDEFEAKKAQILGL